MKPLASLCLILSACAGGPPEPPATNPDPVVSETATAEVVTPVETRDAGSEEPAAAEETANRLEQTAPEEAPIEKAPSRTVRFEWCPSKRVADAYEMSDPADQHAVILTPGVEKGGTYPVVVAFHGQPKRGRNPRDYAFPGQVISLVNEMVEAGEIRPVILVVPVFRFVGGNWPWFNPAAFKKRVAEVLEAEGVEGGDWYLFGHSGAAGCGGGGLNQAHLMSPKAVGFFDTCIGEGWTEELAVLDKANISTLNLHSVETAGFKPRQRPEYQADFDFGRAYGPAGMSPVSCPEERPDPGLRNQKYKCAASRSGNIEGFVIDTGEGVEAHKAIIDPAVRFFLTVFAGLGAGEAP